MRVDVDLHHGVQFPGAQSHIPEQNVVTESSSVVSPESANNQIFQPEILPDIDEVKT